jgi:hypothetical protein
VARSSKKAIESLLPVSSTKSCQPIGAASKKKGVREDNGEIGPDGPDGPDNAGEDPLSPDLEPGGSATPEQLRKIRKLVREGMAEGLAREEIRGKGWVEP